MSRPLLLLCLLLTACDGESGALDGGGLDAGIAADAGARDAGPSDDAGTEDDAGTTDAGTTDAGTTDAGTTDAGADEDAGAADAAVDVDAGEDDAGAGDDAGTAGDCDAIRSQYEAAVTSVDAQRCGGPSECHVLSGHCGVGLGGCHYGVSTDVTQAQLDALAETWTDAGCSGPVCRCAAPPTVRCDAGGCLLMSTF